MMAAALGLVGEPASAADDGRFTAARCSELILLFDRIVLSRYDHRLLGVERYELDEARALRRQAERDCAAGRIWFGVHAAEDALLRIHVVPEGLPSRERSAAGSGRTATHRSARMQASQRGRRERQIRLAWRIRRM